MNPTLLIVTFYCRPDEQMLHALYMVLENEVNNLEPIFILGPTSVVHTFCRNHGECGENSVVKDFIGFLETNILETLQKDLSVRRNREKVSYFFVAIPFLFNYLKLFLN